MPLAFPLRSGQSPRPKQALTADAVLAGAVIAAVALMIVPLPTWLLDLLLASNLAVSVGILLVTLYVGDALQIAAFPTLLLITTLVRLALNVSSTRLILLRGQAGEVIASFGQFVVSGNYIVGAVVFLILVIIQFVVIAKGSERVAEVAARFALDAMPGKQMAIDADLRAGVIDAVQAQQRRQALNREGQFYGAMDGAMKFVRGDVIAASLITCINLGAGLAIGIGQRGMSAIAAVQKYGLLTIGDGLISQIPALILATSAGLLVTRVASEDRRTTLGEQLSLQVLGMPRALSVAGGFIAALALVPGLPVLPFLSIGALLLLAARVRSRSAARSQSEAMTIQLPSAWAVVVGPDLVARLSDGENGLASVESATELARQTLFKQLGVLLPPCDVGVRKEVPRGSVVLSIREVPSKRISPSSRLEGAAARRDLAERLASELEARAPDFMGLREAQLLLDEVARVSPTSVEQVVPRLVSLPTLTEILRRLVEEGVSVRDMASILEALAQAAQGQSDPLLLAEHVRSWLRRAITFDVTRGSGQLAPLTLHQTIEDTVRDAISQTSSGTYLTLSPAAGRDISRSVVSALKECSEELQRHPVVLTQPDIRRFVRKLLEAELPKVRVVTFTELLPETTIAPAGVVRPIS